MRHKKNTFKVVGTILIGFLSALLLKWVVFAPPSSTDTVQTSSVTTASNAHSTETNKSSAVSLFQGDLASQKVLAQKVIADIERGITANDFQTGSARYDGEWAVGSYQMAVLGLGQVITAHPEMKATYLPVMNRGVEALLTPEMNQFGSEAWGSEGLRALGTDDGHAYLGYTNLALSMLRLHDPNNELASVNDALTQALLRRLEQTPYGIVETYPNEVYPADLAAVIGSIALYDTATGQDHSQPLKKLINHFVQNYLDDKSGLVFQAIDASSREPVDHPRASGTSLSAYFLSFADSEVASTVFQSVKEHQKLEIFNLVGIKEYPKGKIGDGDIDSGTLVSGVSPAATAFAISGARITQDLPLYQTLYKTVDFFGSSPLATTENQSLIESPLGNAVLLAMITAK